MKDPLDEIFIDKPKPIIEQLKSYYEGWSLSVKIRNEVRNSAKIFLKQKEKELKDAKRVLYLTTKSWNEARVNEKKARNRFKGFISQRRSWAKHNLGKVFNKIEERELTQKIKGKEE
ncbi:MAG: hypothetical protein PHZ25_01660 [Candidatus Pacebacteria bacterium]|nr:hypothetical protein [Candidatus Paceibacterota bacterium]